MRKFFFKLFICSPARIGVLFFYAAFACAGSANCSTGAKPECYLSFKPAAQQENMHYYSSVIPSTQASVNSVTRAFVAMHGYPRDANKTFNAALAAVKGAGDTGNTVVIAPVYQVVPDQAKKCSTQGVPVAVKGDLTWSCSDWLEGGVSSGSQAISSFAVMDELVKQLQKDFPNLRNITIAGFSAGAQMVQHYAAFAADVLPPVLAIRYVVSDPGAWLYFDTLRAQPYLAGKQVAWTQCQGGTQGLGQCELRLEQPSRICPQINNWKYGLDNLPSNLSRDAAQARAHYASADVRYLEGSLDRSAAKGTYYGLLDKSCAASAQGSFRLQRGIVYGFYDRTLLAPAKNRKVTIVPGCSHDVACVFPSAQARAVLFDD